MTTSARLVAVLGCAAIVGLACGRVPGVAAGRPGMPASCVSAFQLPGDVLAVPDPMPPIVNRSRLGSQDSSAWARSMMRSLRIEAWATANSRDDLLTSGCLGDTRAQAQLFGDEAYLIGIARRTNSALVVTPAQVVKLTLVEVSAQQRAIVARAQQDSSQYAWLVTTKGPAGILLVAPNGDTHDVIGLRDDELATDFYGGFLAADSWAAPLWFQMSYYSCASTIGRSLCA